MSLNFTYYDFLKVTRIAGLYTPFLLGSVPIILIFSNFLFLFCPRLFAGWGNTVASGSRLLYKWTKKVLKKGKWGGYLNHGGFDQKNIFCVPFLSILLFLRPFLRKAGANPESFSRDGKKKVDSYIKKLAEKLNINKVHM